MKTLLRWMFVALCILTPPIGWMFLLFYILMVPTTEEVDE